MATDYHFDQSEEIGSLYRSVVILSCGSTETEAGEWNAFLNKFQERRIIHFNSLYCTLNSGMAK
jgi:hypothetical protein